MTYQSLYMQQINLLARLLTSVKRESCFALKGGTAINLFFHDLPRLSIDIDLTYLPIKERDTSLQDIHESLQRMAQDILFRNKGIIINYKKQHKRIQKLIVGNNERIKIEPNETLRGNLYPIEYRNLCPKAETMLGITLNEIPMVSFEEIYAGKICAALDRQHPRDLFDILFLYKTTGITQKILDAFIIYLCCCSRPIHELLNPNLNFSEETFKNEFMGMTNKIIHFNDLVDIQKQLIKDLGSKINDIQKSFLLSIKEGLPNYELMPFLNLHQFPALQWKVHNINKMSEERKKIMKNKLIEVLSNLN